MLICLVFNYVFIYYWLNLSLVTKWFFLNSTFIVRFFLFLNIKKTYQLMVIRSLEVQCTGQSGQMSYLFPNGQRAQCSVGVTGEQRGFLSFFFFYPPDYPSFLDFFNLCFHGLIDSFPSIVFFVLLIVKWFYLSICCFSMSWSQLPLASKRVSGFSI